MKYRSGLSVARMQAFAVIREAGSFNFSSPPSCAWFPSSRWLRHPRWLWEYPPSGYDSRQERDEWGRGGEWWFYQPSQLLKPHPTMFVHISLATWD